MLQKFSYWTFCVQCFQVPNMKFEFQIIHRKFTTSCSNEDCWFACSLILVMCIYVWYWPLSPLFTIESAAWQNQVKHQFLLLALGVQFLWHCWELFDNSSWLKGEVNRHSNIISKDFNFYKLIHPCSSEQGKTFQVVHVMRYGYYRLYGNLQLPISFILGNLCDLWSFLLSWVAWHSNMCSMLEKAWWSI